MIFDPVDLDRPDIDPADYSDQIAATAAEHGVRLTVVSRTVGPTVTRYRVQLGAGVRPDRIAAALTSSWSLALARVVRYVGPPADTATYVEVPNDTRATVQLGEVMDPDAIEPGEPLRIPFGIGVDTNPLSRRLDSLPHLLVAGATGQGKSVYLNAVLVSLLAQAGPDHLRLALVDPKRVELASFASLPHLIAPIATDGPSAQSVLTAAVATMDARYRMMESDGTKLYEGPPLVVVVDELADLMLANRKAVEPLLVRLAQVGRAARVHLIVATQYPRADVVTPLIKQNIPTRVSFLVSDQTASRVVLDRTGADLLVGNGDGLVVLNGQPTPRRFQAPLVTEDEIVRAVAAHAVPAEPEPEPVPYAPPPEHVAAVEAAAAQAEQARTVVESVAPAPRELTAAEQIDAEILADLRDRGPQTRETVRLLEERVRVLEEAYATLLERMAPPSRRY